MIIVVVIVINRRKYRRAQWSNLRLMWSSAMYRTIQKPLITLISLSSCSDVLWSSWRCLIPKLKKSIKLDFLFPKKNHT